MDLSERKKQILRAIVDGYIRTAEPVGSSYVLQNNDLGISSATIRNEMAYLEETGADPELIADMHAYLAKYGAKQN